MITTREIVDRLKDIYDRLAAAASFRWGVVVSTTPPLVRLDADTDPVIVGTLMPLTVGSRVLVLLHNRKNTVIGSSGGGVLTGAPAATDSIQPILNIPARPLGTLWPQAFAWDEATQQYYIALVGTIEGTATLRIERRSASGSLIDSRDMPVSTASEGLPYWHTSGGDLCFMIRPTASGHYAIFNYTTGVQGSPIPIQGWYKAAHHGDSLWTCDQTSIASGITRIYEYDWETVQNGAPLLRRTIPLERPNFYPKLQSFAGNGDLFHLNMGQSHGIPGLFAYTRAGRKTLGWEYDLPTFGAIINETYPGTLTNPHAFEHESEGCAYMDGALLTGHVVYNGPASTARFIIMRHGTGTPIPVTEITNEFDTGWQELTIADPTIFAPWLPTSPIRYRRRDYTVEITGELATLTAVWEGVTLGTLPAGFRPGTKRSIVQQGSSSNRWSLAIHPNGGLIPERYGPAAAASGSWLPISANYLTG